jgi:hypothetical protein
LSIVVEEITRAGGHDAMGEIVAEAPGLLGLAEKTTTLVIPLVRLTSIA